MLGSTRKSKTRSCQGKTWEEADAVAVVLPRFLLCLPNLISPVSWPWVHSPPTLHENFVVTVLGIVSPCVLYQLWPRTSLCSLLCHPLLILVPLLKHILPDQGFTHSVTASRTPVKRCQSPPWWNLTEWHLPSLSCSLFLHSNHHNLTYYVFVCFSYLVTSLEFKHCGNFSPTFRTGTQYNCVKHWIK